MVTPSFVSLPRTQQPASRRQAERRVFKWGFGLGFAMGLLSAALFVLGVYVGTARAQDAPDRSYFSGSWLFLGEGRAPATLRDCPIWTVITVNTNVGTYWPWRRFCYWGKTQQGK